MMPQRKMAEQSMRLVCMKKVYLSFANCQMLKVSIIELKPIIPLLKGKGPHALLLLMWLQPHKMLDT
ncbi:hypothetical protein KSC_104170 [Ktedonobacter sp. SOSP1-52]|nr:hypothetical protein KSC_104170 [Ktedonobacter sp. SOSP1-52]